MDRLASDPAFIGPQKEIRPAVVLVVERLRAQ